MLSDFKGFFAGYLGNNPHSRFLGNLSHYFKTLFFKTLERVRRGTGLIRSPAEYFCSACFSGHSGFKQLFFTFYCAGACHNCKMASAYFYSADVYYGRVGLKGFICKLIGFAYGYYSVNSGHCFRVLFQKLSFIADNADYRKGTTP